MNIPMVKKQCVSVNKENLLSPSKTIELWFTTMLLGFYMILPTSIFLGHYEKKEKKSPLFPCFLDEGQNQLQGVKHMMTL